MMDGLASIKIDKDIQIPVAKRGGPKGESKYPFAQMAVGDSFVFPMHKDGLRRTGQVAGGHAAYHGRKCAARFSIRTVEEDGKRVVRVWRTA